MANQSEFQTKVLQRFAGEIAALTNEMKTVAQTALKLSQDGYDDRAMDGLHDLESLLSDTRTLLLASSLLRRLALKPVRVGL